ncbi:MAG: DUF4398 domain-containing protein [Parcubacteria group bacterium]|nr:DUF4398 domain-containing protein [Parcubacteria group bacterium]
MLHLFSKELLVQTRSNDFSDQQIRCFSFSLKDDQLPFLGTILAVGMTRKVSKSDFERIKKSILKMEQYFFREGDISPDPASISLHFENALQRVNDDLYEIISDASKNITPESLDLFIGLVVKRDDNKEYDIHISNFGALSAYLVHKTQLSAYKVIPIQDLSPDVSPKTASAKIFSNLISGTILPDDAIFILHPDMLQYLSLDQIKEYLTLHRWEKGLKSIFHSLNALNGKIPWVFAFLCPPILSKETLSRGTLGSKSQQSMDALQYTEHSTERLLAPTTSLNFKVGLQRLGLWFSEGWLKNFFARGWFAQIRNNSLRSLNNASKKSQTMYQTLYKAQGNQAPTKPLLSDMKRSSRFFQKASLGQKIKSSLNILPLTILGTRNTITRLSSLSKYLLLGSTILFALFLTNVFWTKKEQTAELTQSKTQTILAEAKDLLDKAEAANIFKNNERTRSLLKQAQEKFASVASNNPESSPIEEEALIKSRIERLEEKLAKKTPLTLTPIYQLDANDSKRIAVAEKIETSLSIVFNDGSMDILETDTNTKKSVATEIFASPGISAVDDQKNLIFVDGASHTLKKLDDESDVISIPSDRIDFQIIALENYERNLYFFDSEEKKLFKQQRLDKGYTRESGWISDEKIVTEDIADIAVDGFVYLLHSNGNVERLLKGKISTPPFSLEAVNPPLQSGYRIETTIDSDTIAILDRAFGRIVIFDKQGKLMIQLLSESLKTALDFFMDDQKNKLYIFSEKEIFTADMVLIS